MELHVPLTRVVQCAGTCCLLLLFASGCVSPISRPDVPDLASQVTGLPNAISFQTLGGPIDAPGTDPATLTLIEATRRAVSTDAACHTRVQPFR